MFGMFDGCLSVQMKIFIVFVRDRVTSSGLFSEPQLRVKMLSVIHL